MNRSLLAALAVLLLLSPASSHAQSGPAAPVVVEPTPASAVDDEGMWIDDDLLAFGLDEDFVFDTVDFDGLEAGGMQVEVEMADDDASAAPGERRIVERRIVRGGPDGPDGPSGAPRTMIVRTGPGGMGQPGMRGSMHGQRMRMMNRHGMAMRLAQLGLTDDQRTKMRGLHEAAMRKDIQRRADLQLAMLDLRKAMRADKPEAAAVNAQIDRIAKLRADAMKSRFETRMQARALLTPEQLKKLGERPGGMGGPGAPGAPGGPGMGHGRGGMRGHGGR